MSINLYFYNNLFYQELSIFISFLEFNNKHNKYQLWSFINFFLLLGVFSFIFLLIELHGIFIQAICCKNYKK